MDMYKEILTVQQENSPAVLATVVQVSGSAPGRPCARMLVKADGSIAGTIGGGAIEKKIIDEAHRLMTGSETALLHYNLEELGMTCGGTMTVFLEPIVRKPELLIFGAGHIGTALSRISKMLDFSVTIVDDRLEFADKNRLDWADRVIAGDYQQALRELTFCDTTYIVIVTHGHAHDYEVLEYCISRTFCYLGMIGSRKKVSAAFEQLQANGVSGDIIKRIHAPIGLDIGGNSPAEIAVAIAAELVAVRSGKKVNGLKQ